MNDEDDGNPVTSRCSRGGTVVSTTENSMWFETRRCATPLTPVEIWTKRGIEMIKDGRVVRISQLIPAISSVRRHHARTSNGREGSRVKVADAKMEPAPAKAAPAAAPAAAHRERTPAAAPHRLSNTPALPRLARRRHHRRSRSPGCFGRDFIALALVAFFVMRKKRLTYQGEEMIRNLDVRLEY